MPILYITIGCPASGKSHWAEQQCAKDQNTVCFDSDSIRQELLNDALRQDRNNEVFQEMHKRTLLALKEGKDVIYCATNMHYKDRAAIIKTVRNNFNDDISIVAKVFIVPISICKERNINRERKVPDYVFDKMVSRFIFPSHWEGFDAISVARPYPVNNLKELLDEAKDFNQNNPHHSLTLGDHMWAAEKFARENNYDEYVRQAALYHDIGKLFTESKDEKEISHFYNHENYSSYLLAMNGIHNHICALVSWHMLLWRHDEKYINRIKAEMGEYFYNGLEKLHLCDKAAH